jgi:hypothetical protein
VTSENEDRFAAALATFAAIDGPLIAVWLGLHALSPPAWVWLLTIFAAGMAAGAVYRHARLIDGRHD